jgi:signal transduction histidine kinase
MEKIRNLSIRKTILLYLAVGLICSFLLSTVIVKIATYTQEQIWWNYADQDKYFEAVNEEERGYRAEIPRPSSSDMSSADRSISELCDFLQTYTVLILSFTASGASVFLFYKHKLKPPIEELEQASGRIAGNDLDFHITYENQDEMGRLCGEFERMRGQLAQNNKELWRMVEEERVLRAAIAHDIRSPLSVLKGYQEMLMDYLPDGTVDTETAMGMLEESRKQIERMDHFVETMRKMSSLEQRTLVSRPITAEEIKADIMAELVVLEAEKEKQVIMKVQETTDRFQGDKEVVLEVTENLLSNALRYAKKQITINVSVTRQELMICVEDDGRGFDSDMETVTKAFYQQNVKDSLNHSGMGMYISRLYCEKHGGRLVLENKAAGGTSVTAVFRRIA